MKDIHATDKRLLHYSEIFLFKILLFGNSSPVDAHTNTKILKAIIEYISTSKILGPW